ncbi:MAG: cell division protein FtsA [Akkermansia sp.]|nr:cell division protein FtsA [Akkermansia sp.]
MAQSKILVGLEIGTSKTCMVVGEIRPDATATIIGIGEVKSCGVKKGEITDLSLARQCVCDAWQLAQDHADVDILNVFLSVTGEHIVGENNVGSFRLPDDQDVIDDEHADIAKEKAEKLELASDRFPINRELGGFSIDSGEPTRHPAGLSGRTLDVNCHVMHGIRTRLQNSLRCVRQVPLEVEDLVFAPLATAQMVLNRQQKEAGALLIDIGGGTTDFICFKGGDVVASGCIPMGGNTINQQIVRISDERASRDAAETLKRTEGNAFGDIKDHSLAQYKGTHGMHDVTIERGKLNLAIRNSMAAMLLQVRDRIPAELLNSGMSIFLSGGSSLMRGLDKLTEYIFKGMTVHQPAPLPPGHNHSYLADPRYCTAIGLIRFAQRYDDDAIRAPRPGVFSRFLNFLRRGH